MICALPSAVKFACRINNECHPSSHEPRRTAQDAKTGGWGIYVSTYDDGVLCGGGVPSRFQLPFKRHRVSDGTARVSGNICAWPLPVTPLRYYHNRTLTFGVSAWVHNRNASCGGVLYYVWGPAWLLRASRALIENTHLCTYNKQELMCVRYVQDQVFLPYARFPVRGCNISRVFFLFRGESFYSHMERECII